MKNLVLTAILATGLLSANAFAYTTWASVPANAGSLFNSACSMAAENALNAAKRACLNVNRTISNDYVVGHCEDRVRESRTVDGLPGMSTETVVSVYVKFVTVTYRCQN